MPIRSRAAPLVTLFALVVAHAFGSSNEYVPMPIIEVGRPTLEDIAYSPDGRVLATLTTEWVELLDADTYEPVARFGRGGEEIAFSPDGSEIGVFDRYHAGAVYDAAAGAFKDELPKSIAYAMSPDWRRFAYAEGDVVHLWDRDAQGVTSTLAGDPLPFLTGVTRSFDNGSSTTSTSRPGVTALAFHPDGVRLLVMSHRRTVALWDTSSERVIRHFDFGMTWVRDVAIRPDGTEFAARTWHGLHFVWAFDDPEPRPVTTTPPLGSWLHYDRDGEHLWSTGDEGLVHRVDTRDGAVAVAWTRGRPDEDAPYAWNLATHPQRQRIAAVVGHRYGDRIGVWATDTMELEGMVDLAWGVRSWTGGATYLPKRGQVVTFGGVLRRWDIANADVFDAYDIPAQYRRVIVSDDGSVGVADAWPETHVFSTATGQLLIRLRTPTRVAISPSGKYFASVDNPTSIYAVAGNQRVASLPTTGANPLGQAFTPSERRFLLHTSTGSLQVWDIAESRLMMTVPNAGPFAATDHGILHVVLPRDILPPGSLEVRRVGDPTPVSVISPMWSLRGGDLHRRVDIDPSGRYVTIRDTDPTTAESIVRFHAAQTGALLATRPSSARVEFTAGSDYLFANGPDGGRALYRTEEFLNIPSHDVTPRNKLLTAWGDVKRTQLLPNYPNPFNPETWIPFDLAAPGPVIVSVYDDLGRVIRRVDLGHMSAGAYRSRDRAAYWDGHNDAGEPVASGSYFIELSAGAHRQTRRTTLAK